jgi:hypothetical protein
MRKKKRRRRRKNERVVGRVVGSGETLDVLVGISSPETNRRKTIREGSEVNVVCRVGMMSFKNRSYLLL